MATPAPKRTRTYTHWGAYDVEVAGGTSTAVRPHSEDPDPSLIGKSFEDSVHHRSRITQPAVRKGWLERGPEKHGGGRGDEPFVAVSWDKALDLVASELGRVKEMHGNEAIFAGSYGWASAGRFHHAQSQIHRFLKQFGGYTYSVNSYSTAAASVNALLGIWGEAPTANELMSLPQALAILESRGLVVMPLRGASLATLELFNYPAILQLSALSLIDMGDPYPWYLTALFPPLLILAASGTVKAFEQALERWRPAHVATIAVLLVLFIAGTQGRTRHSLRSALDHDNPVRSYEAFDFDRRLAGIFIDQYAAPDEVVASAYGWVAFESRRPFNDLSRLNSRSLLPDPAYLVDHGHPHHVGSHAPTGPEGFEPVAHFDLASEVGPGYSWFTVFAHPESRIARLGPRFLKIRLRDFPTPRPFSPALGLDGVRLDVEEISAPPPSGLSLTFDTPEVDSLLFRVEPYLRQGPTTTPSARVGFEVYVDGNPVFAEELTTAPGQAPVVVPIRSSNATFTVSLVTRAMDPAAEQQLDAGWSGPKLILGAPQLDLDRVPDRALRDMWMQNNPPAATSHQLAEAGTWKGASPP